MAVLPATGTISYNGYSFGVETQILGFDWRPIWDEANRTIVSNVLTLSVRTKLISAAGSTIDATVTDAITKLTQPGRELTFETKGAGSWKFGRADRRDLSWGPKPTVLSLRRIAGDRAWELDWKIEAQTYTCSSGQDQFRVMAWNYQVDYEIDRDRMTRRVVTGYIQIPQSRLDGDRKLAETADDYYLDFIPTVPLKFRRENERRTISKDKCRCDYSYVDQEIKHPLPIGCIDAQIDHYVTNTSPNTLFQWQGVLSARYEMAAHAEMGEAVNHFMLLIQDRIHTAARNEVRRRGGSVCLVRTLTVREDVYDRRVSCSAVYWATVGLPTLLTAGMFRPIPGTNYLLWSVSMQFANRPRGYAGLRQSPGDDIIIDVCGDGAVGRGVGPTLVEQANAWDRELIKVPCPPPEKSWLLYKVKVTIERDDQTVEHKPLPQKHFSLSELFGKAMTPNGPIVPPGFGPKSGPGLPQTYNEAPLIQRRASPSIYVVLTGTAERACYPIPEPFVLTYNGRGVVSANRQDQEFFTHETAGNAGVPIYKATWRRRFLVPGIVEEELKKPQDVAPNPLAPDRPIPIEVNN